MFRADVVLVYHDFKTQEGILRQAVKALQNDIGTIILISNGSKPFKEVFDLFVSEGLLASCQCKGFDFAKNEEVTPANTKGIQIFLNETTSPYLAIIDPGSSFSHDWLHNMIHAFETNTFTAEGTPLRKVNIY